MAWTAWAIAWRVEFAVSYLCAMEEYYFEFNGEENLKPLSNIEKELDR